MRQAIYNLLSGDATFLAALPGGVYDLAVVDEISRQATPVAFDANKELQPCAALRLNGPVPVRPYDHGARLTFELYFYERFGFASIEPARERAYDLLHLAKLTPVGSTAGNWEIRHADDVLQQRDEALRASLEMSRFEAVILRRR